MARLALVVLAFGLIICVYAESEEYQKQSYQLDSDYSRSQGHYDNCRNKGRDNKWKDKSWRHGFNKNKKGYNRYYKGRNNPVYHFPGGSRGSGCDCDHNKGGHPNYKGSIGGYPNYEGSNGGYPNYKGSNGGYPNYKGSYGRYPNYKGSNGRYPHYKGSYGRYPNYKGSNGRYPNYKGSNDRYPNYKGSNGGYLNYKGSNGGSYKNSGEDYNREDYEYGQNNNLNHKDEDHMKVDYHGYEKSKGSGYDSDHNNGPSYKKPYDPGYDLDYSRGDYGSSKNNNFNYVKNKSHGSNDEIKNGDFNKYKPVYKGGNYDYNYNRFYSDVKSSADKRDSKERRKIDTPSPDADANDGRSHSVEHDYDTAKDTRNKQKTDSESTSNVGIINNADYSNQHTNVSTGHVDDYTIAIPSTNKKQKTERIKNDGLITNYQVNNQDNKVGITVRTDSDAVNNDTGRQTISIVE